MGGRSSSGEWGSSGNTGGGGGGGDNGAGGSGGEVSGFCVSMDVDFPSDLTPSTCGLTG